MHGQTLYTVGTISQKTGEIIPLVTSSGNKVENNCTGDGYLLDVTTSGDRWQFSTMNGVFSVHEIFVFTSLDSHK